MQKSKEASPTERSEPASGGTKRLQRSKSDRMIAGVCGGVAEYFGIDALVVRLLWAVAVLVGGTGLFGYVLAWIIIPENPAQSDAKKESGRNSSAIWGGLLVIVGILFLLRQLQWVDFHPFRYRAYWHPQFWDFDFDLFFPVILIALGAFYVYSVLTKEKKNQGQVSAPERGGQKVDKKLTRSSQERMLAGVCGGLANYFNIDPSLVRIGFALLTLASGGLAGIIAYIVMMVVIPEDGGVQADPGPAKAAPKKPAAKPKARASATKTPKNK